MQSKRILGMGSRKTAEQAGAGLCLTGGGLPHHVSDTEYLQRGERSCNNWLQLQFRLSGEQTVFYTLSIHSILSWFVFAHTDATNKNSLWEDQMIPLYIPRTYLGEDPSVGYV